MKALPDMLALALPGGALVFAVAAFGLHKLSMRKFDRKHPGLRRREAP